MSWFMVSRWITHNINTSDRILWRRRSIFFPNICQGDEKNGWNCSKIFGRWWETSNDLCWYVHKWINFSLDSQIKKKIFSHKNRKCCMGTHSCKRNVEKVTKKYCRLASFCYRWHTNRGFRKILSAYVKAYKCIQHSANIMVIAIIVGPLAINFTRTNRYGIESNFWHHTIISTTCIVRICRFTFTIQPSACRIAHELWTAVQWRICIGWECKMVRKMV